MDSPVSAPSAASAHEIEELVAQLLPGATRFGDADRYFLALDWAVAAYRLGLMTGRREVHDLWLTCEGVKPLAE